MKKFALIAVLAAFLLAGAACDGGEDLAGLGGAGDEDSAQTERGGQKGGPGDLVIVVDPGHGGVDKGAIGVTGAREDKLNLAVAKLLTDRFQEAGADVTMTRTGDDVDYSGEGDTQKLKDMNSRAALIRQKDPDALISIHMNISDHSEVYGAQTFYWADNDEGKKLAGCIQDALVSGMPVKSPRDIQSGDYFILHVNDAPSALVECGFLSNPDEEQSLQDPSYQQKLADCIYRGVCDYFGVEP